MNRSNLPDPKIAEDWLRIRKNAKASSAFTDALKGLEAVIKQYPDLSDAMTRAAGRYISDPKTIDENGR